MPQSKTLTLGFSPCPNDTYIFGALATQKISLSFDYQLFIEDVEKLNQWALKEKLTVTKLSFGVFPKIISKYQLLPVGGALGYGCGPVLVARKNNLDLSRVRIAIPGENTTAYLLLKFYCPDLGEVINLRYDQVMSALLKGEVDAGLLIHETRFVYEKFGLYQLVDLGNWWEKETGLPIPLGGIFVKRKLSKEDKEAICKDIKNSLAFAREHIDQIWPFITAHAQELEPKIIKQHIETFVNEFTFSLKEKGQKAVSVFLDKCLEKGLLKRVPENFIFHPQGG
ncbi:hypothetical protein Thein_1288 [Thermodesulfatator indicus DSM 15286]|uniref:1,4-dihydroxy-6-naphtoate synthase n=1 Tax=Thermodesulfatator indicus (strain DSM 15286 / JCM 11887 / CIR29812) TaxID=667014 RepID=F8A927_THEID|nr:1,4-dihydroxy-6-naphthoate synthase [Thermodesulfatator indicus]AEH45155.1 hypothetical protein Thein_1288 [Thermodesulfatator indicus DSM 15286]